MSGKNQYVVLYKGKKIYHQLDKCPDYPWETKRTLCKLPIDPQCDNIFPEPPPGRRFCKYCKRIVAKQVGVK